MKKRIKARVKRAKRVPADYVSEVKSKGRVLTEYRVTLPNGKSIKIQNIRYWGKVYYVVAVLNGLYWDIKDCIEL